MPPSFAVVLIVALGVPAGLRVLIGRPRALLGAHLAAATASLIAQVSGEVAGWRIGLLGDAQLLACGVAAAIASIGVALLERRAD